MTEYTREQIVSALRGKAILTRDGRQVIIYGYDPSPTTKYPLHGNYGEDERSDREVLWWNLDGRYSILDRHALDIDIAYYMGLTKTAAPPVADEPLFVEKPNADDKIAALSFVTEMLARKVALSYQRGAGADILGPLVQHYTTLSRMQSSLMTIEHLKASGGGEK